MVGPERADDVSRDQFAVIRVDGMHCHRCEQTIRRAISVHPGVHEVEVDFLSGQVSVLYNQRVVGVPQMMSAVAAAGYKATGFAQGQANAGDAG